MKNNQGFTLIETMVALLILGILGLMASQGLGGAFRVKDSVEGQIKDQEAVVVITAYLCSRQYLHLAAAALFICASKRLAIYRLHRREQYT
jgi:prepilin-type N-terminal cleavage/methylation domain-containing protein